MDHHRQVTLQPNGKDDEVSTVSFYKSLSLVYSSYDTFKVVLGMIATATVTSIALVVCIYSIFVGPRNQLKSYIFHFLQSCLIEFKMRH